MANAGGSFTKPGPLEETSLEGWHASLDGNLTATFLTIKSILPGMKERKAGNIITISSAAGRRPHPGSPIPYAAAKAGIQMLTQHVATQVGPYGIRVTRHIGIIIVLVLGLSVAARARRGEVVHGDVSL